MRRGRYQHDEDFVTSMMRIIVECIPELTANGRPDAVIRIEQATRIHWGGKRPYIARYPERRHRKRKPDGSV